MVNLRAYVERRFGALQMTIIEGRSMGGAIATLCVENYPHLFQGAVACGAALIWKRETHLPVCYDLCLCLLIVSSTVSLIIRLCHVTRGNDWSYHMYRWHHYCS
jgi:pimeloyl-ACP methyl ester carboxylesterase